MTSRQNTRGPGKTTTAGKNSNIIIIYISSDSDFFDAAVNYIPIPIIVQNITS